MYKLEVLIEINYSNYDNLVSIERKDKDMKGKLFTGDVITVKGKQEADYLCGDNSQNLVACKVIEKIKEENKITKRITKKTNKK